MGESLASPSIKTLQDTSAPVGRFVHEDIGRLPLVDMQDLQTGTLPSLEMPAADAGRSVSRELGFAAGDAGHGDFASYQFGRATRRELAPGEVTGEFLASNLLDSRLLAYTPRGMSKLDGSPITYSFDRSSGKAYWNFGEDNVRREIQAPYRVPTLDEAARAPGNPFALASHAGEILTDFTLLGVGGGLGAAVSVPAVGLAGRGVLGFAADTSTYGLRTAYYLNAPGVNAVGLLGAELALGYEAVAPSPVSFVNGAHALEASMLPPPPKGFVQRTFVPLCMVMEIMFKSSGVI